jgi:phenylpropionate dioxygenase-like ring-hydroxylating dioxygenase large terminal subunit
MLDTDTHAVPVTLRVQAVENEDLGGVSVDRYLSPEIHRQEVERIWTTTWLLACREEAIPEVGDTEVFDVADLSVLVVRVAPDVIKGYFNACLHRGRRLRSGPGRVHELRCPFHGFCWHLDGGLKQVPSAWDFPHVTAESHGLPQVHVACWAGFVFVHLGAEPEPLADFLGGLTEHFERWDLANRHTAAHVEKLLPCNWKVAQAHRYKPDVNYGVVPFPGPDGPAPFASWAGGWSWAIPSGVQSLTSGMAGF